MGFIWALSSTSVLRTDVFSQSESNRSRCGASHHRPKPNLPPQDWPLILNLKKMFTSNLSLYCGGVPALVRHPFRKIHTATVWQLWLLLSALQASEMQNGMLLRRQESLFRVQLDLSRIRWLNWAMRETKLYTTDVTRVCRVKGIVGNCSFFPPTLCLQIH